MKKWSNKSLGIFEIILALAFTGLYIYNMIVSIEYSYILGIVTATLGLLGAVVMFIAAVAMLRDRNDGFTMAAVIMLGIFFLNIAIGVLFVMLLIKRKAGNAEKIGKVWFIPAIVQFILIAISLAMYGGASTLTILSYVLTLTHVINLSNWLLRNLKSSDTAIQEAKAERIAYYTGLLNSGAITKEEYDVYVEKINNDNSDEGINYKKNSFGGTVSTGNGSKTPAGVLIGAIVFILVVIWIVSDIIWGIGFLNLLFN